MKIKRLLVMVCMICSISLIVYANDDVPDKEMAFNYLKTFYGNMSTNSLEEIEVSSDTSLGHSSYGWINEKNSYEVTVTAEDPHLISIYYSRKDIDWDAKEWVLADDAIEEKHDDLRKIIIELYGETEEIISESCEYNIRIEDNVVPHGNLVFLFEFEKDKAVRCMYNCIEDVFWGILYMDSYQAYENQQFSEQSYEYRLKQGIERHKYIFEKQ